MDHGCRDIRDEGCAWSASDVADCVLELAQLYLRGLELGLRGLALLAKRFVRGNKLPVTSFREDLCRMPLGL